MSSEIQIKVGDRVKPCGPRWTASERACRFVVAEVLPPKGGNDTSPTRVVITLICSMTILPQETVLLADVELAD